MNTPDMSADCPANSAAGRTAQVFTAAVFTAALLLAPGGVRQAEAQNIGDPVSVSNFGLRDLGDGAYPIGNADNQQRSNGFTTGGTTSDYFLVRDVTLVINAINGSPGNLRITISAANEVNALDGRAHAPTGQPLVTIDGGAVSSMGQQEFAAPPGSILQGGTTYALVASAPSAGSSNVNYQVKSIASDDEASDSSAGWEIGDVSLDSRGGSTWPPSGSARTSLAFRIRGTVAPPPLGLSAPADQNDYFAGMAITPLTLPAATSGTSPYTYTLTPDLPDGLSFNANTRVLSGTPTAFMAATNYTYGVSDSSGETATANFRIAVGTCAVDLGAVNVAIINRPFATHANCNASQTSTGNNGNRSIFVTFTSGMAGQYRIDLTGGGGNRNDAYLVLRAGADNRSGASLAVDDDGGAGFNSRIMHTLTADTTYTLELTRLGWQSGGVANPGPMRLSITSPLFAVCPSISQAVNGPITVDDNATCEVTAGGVINNSNPLGGLIGSNTTRRNNYNQVNNATVTNRGSIISTRGWGVLLSGADNTYTNYGTASSATDEHSAVSIGEDSNVGAIRGTVLNEAGGSITSTGPRRSAGVYMRGDFHRLENRGTISASGNHHGGGLLQSHAVEQRGANNTLINEGAGSITSTGNLTAVSQHAGGNNTVIVRGGSITGMHSNADGIEQNGDNGTITISGGTVSGGRDGAYQRDNNGIITVGDGATVTGGRDGIRTTGNDGTIKVGGTVEGGTGGFAIRVGGTGNLIILGATAVLDGTYDLGTPGDNTLLRVAAPTVQADIPTQNLNTAGDSTVVDLSTVFTSGEALTYSAVSSNQAVATVAVTAGDATATLTITAVAPGNATVTVTATDSLGQMTPLVFAVEVLGGTRAALALDSPGNLQFVVGEAVNHSLPRARGGAESYRYSLTPLALPPGLLFTANPPRISGTPQTLTPSAAYTYAVVDAAATRRSVTFRISVVDYGTSSRVNEVILPRMARAVAAATATAVVNRAEQLSGARPGAATATLGGRSLSTLSDGADDPHALAETAKMLRDAAEAGEWRRLLDGTGLSLSFAGGESAGGGDGGVSLWLRGEHREMSGKNESDDGANKPQVTFDGKLSGMHLGVDARVHRNVLVGLAGSLLDGKADYAYSRPAGGVESGDYAIEVTTASPYLGWRAGRVSGWAMLGGGTGEVRIRAAGEAERKGDVAVRNSGVGFAGRLYGRGTAELRLRAEVVNGGLEVEDADANAAADEVLQGVDVRAQRGRLALEVENVVRLSDGVLVRSAAAAGAVNDGGDGGGGSAGEVSARLGLDRGRIAMDLAARSLVGQGGGAKEWGASGGLRVRAGADGQGLALRLQPEYGADSASGVRALWRRGVTGLSGDAAEYSMRVEARLGYGMRVPGRDGLLTPFVESVNGGSDSVRLGMNWHSKLGRESSLELALLGERDAEGNAVLLKGSVYFGR